MGQDFYGMQINHCFDTYDNCRAFMRMRPMCLTTTTPSYQVATLECQSPPLISESSTRSSVKTVTMKPLAEEKNTALNCHLPHAVCPRSQFLTDARETRVEVLYQTWLDHLIRQRQFQGPSHDDVLVEVPAERNPWPCVELTWLPVLTWKSQGKPTGENM